LHRPHCLARVSFGGSSEPLSSTSTRCALFKVDWGSSYLSRGKLHWDWVFPALLETISEHPARCGRGQEDGFIMLLHLSVRGQRIMRTAFALLTSIGETRVGVEDESTSRVDVLHWWSRSVADLAVKVWQRGLLKGEATSKDSEFWATRSLTFSCGGFLLVAVVQDTSTLWFRLAIRRALR